MADAMTDRQASRGRPRAFDAEEALSAALRVFWAKGYEGASLTDLTSAMAITRPSLYAAFGNKAALFRKALDLYEAEKRAYVSAALSEPTGRRVVLHLLRGSVAACANGSDPHGCLGVIASTAGGAEGGPIREEVATRNRAVHKMIVARMERAAAEGDFNQSIDPRALTEYVFTVMQGIALEAGAGTPRHKLDMIAETALASWPGR